MSLYFLQENAFFPAIYLVFYQTKQQPFLLS